ncbi:MAG: hypothetical protein ABF624_01605 [Liquorilactobacillus ghanensis]|uniref:hypothetical protein n=1 Tax=Liquorilactobacillus ghanensis TaxID=399370 RepID=UPI0039E8CABF
MRFTPRELLKVTDERGADFVKLVEIGGDDVAMILSGYVVSLDIPDELIKEKLNEKAQTEND